MALAVDATSTSGNKGTDPWTWSHTCTGSDLVLFVGVSFFSSATTISSMDYNGDSMTEIAGASINNNSRQASIYYLINPDTGTHTITVDFNVTAFGVAGGISFTGADQTTQPDATAEESGTSATTNVLNITTGVDDTFIVDAIATDTIFTNNDLNEVGSQTEIYRGFPTNVDAGGSYKIAASTGAFTMTWTWTMVFSTTSYSHAGISVNPAAPAPTGIASMRQLVGHGQGTR